MNKGQICLEKIIIGRNDQPCFMGDFDQRGNDLFDSLDSAAGS